MVEVREIDNSKILEISELEAKTYRDFSFDSDKQYAVGCGDDRPATPESLVRLPVGVETDGTMVRYYGGIWGVARVLAVAITQTYGMDTVSDTNIFTRFADQVKAKMEAKTNLCFTVHSAEANEDESRDALNTNSKKAVGCAYAASIGGVSALNSDNHITAVATAEATEMGDKEVDNRFTAIVQANKDVFGLFFSTDSAAALTREDFAESGMPDLILEGSHRHISDGAKAVINFRHDRVSNPTDADETVGKFYNNDVTIVTEAIMRTFPELKLDPHMILDIMIEDIAATRQALAGHEDLCAEDLKPARYGDYAKALSYLNSVANKLY